MNIYSTGMNPADSNALKRQPRVRLFQAYVEMMKRLQTRENEVTWRATKVGDQLPRNTGVVIVSSMLPRSLNCPYALGVIWTISEALRKNIPLVIYLTDWAFFKSNGEFKSIAKAGAEYFFKTIGGQPQYNEDPAKLRAAADDLLDICYQWNVPDSMLWREAQILVPRYTNWGDISLIQEWYPGAKPIMTMDPTPIFLEYLETDPHPAALLPMYQRQKTWILPSLLNDDTWLMKQRLRWDVQRYGPKGFEVLESERAIQNAYRRNVGALCPPYPHEGSGWWRSRWLHSAEALSILLCGEKDAKAVGPAYQLDGRYYESTSSTILSDLAQYQAETMFKLAQTDMELLDEQIQQALEGAAS